MKVVIKANIFHESAGERIRRCLDHLDKKGVEVCVHKDMLPFVEGRNYKVVNAVDDIPTDATLAIALGGDGTVLSTARLVADRELPVYGANLGNFGFLTTSALEDFERDFERIIDGDFEVEDRMVIKAELIGKSDARHEFYALNDLVLHKGAISRPIVISLEAGSDLVGSFPADGVIISTPTGSTAYSLSAGGPILYPKMQAVTITPISAHSLAVRPLCIPADIPITLMEKSKHEEVLLTIDGQENVKVTEEDRIVVTRAGYVTRLVRPFEGSFFDRLRSKLKWGEREKII